MSEITKYDVASQIIGWVYFTSWTISFYGQIYENYILKRVEGIKFDYVYLNITGYTFYSIALSVGYFGGLEQGVGGVQIQDLLFSYHGVIMSIIQLVQMFIYPAGQNKVSKITKNIIAIYCAIIIFYYFLTKIADLFTPPDYLNVWNILGYIKVGITVKKYLIQSYYNFKRKSTEGWSIFNVLCDFTGGCLSFLQTFIDYSFRDINFVIPKIALGLFTINFDIVFILQHYVIYKQPNTQDIELKRLYQEKQIPESENISDQDDDQLSNISEQTKSKQNPQQVNS